MPSFMKVLKAKSKPHRERGQIAGRKHLGRLQKKKDYKVRADRKRKKDDEMKNLRQKALERNPDEFFYKMITQAKQRKMDPELSFGDADTDDEFETELATDKEKKLLTQDANYVSWKLQIEKKKVKKLEDHLKLCQSVGKPKNQHIYFVDGKEKPSSPVSPVLNFDSNEEDISILKKELNSRRERLKELQIVSDKMMVRKDLQANPKQSKVVVRKDSNDESALYKWKPLRKK